LTLALVMLGAAVGAACRWLTDRFIQARHDSVFPWGTFTVNVLGSLLLGMVLAAADGRTALVALLGTGFCGGFTTFSTFGVETLRLATDGSGLQSMLNVLASLAAGLAAAFAGWYLVAWV
jgi:CrcB protein